MGVMMHSQGRGRSSESTSLNRCDWSRLNTLQLGRYAEYFVKMEFTLYGFEVYTSEVDDRCIDFVVRRGSERFYEVQVKSVRGYNYVFIPKAKFQIASNRIVALVLFHQGREPELFLMRMDCWNTPDALFVSRDYEGKKSKPEWGLNLSAKNQKLLNQYGFERVIQRGFKPV